MLFAPSHDDTYQFVKIHHYALGPHESMGRMELARLDYMLSSPLHTCVHCISRIMDSSSCLHTCTLWRPLWNVHLYQHSLDWFVTSLHYLFSNKKKISFWLPNQNYWYLVNRTSVSPPCFPLAAAPHGMRIAGSGGDFVKSALCGLYILEMYKLQQSTLLLAIPTIV